MLSNFGSPHSVRLKIDEKSPKRRLPDGEPVEERIRNNSFLFVLCAPFLPIYTTIWGSRCQESCQASDETKLGTIVSFIFGTPFLKELQVHYFKTWIPIPAKLGALSTTVLIVLFAGLFSNHAMTATFGLNPLGLSGSLKYCDNDMAERKANSIRERLEMLTHYRSAMEQRHFATLILEAIQNDTALYGTTYDGNDFTCQNSPYTKEEFRDSKGRIDFFPGQCLSAQRKALEHARQQTCERTICQSDLIVDEESIVAENGEVDVFCRNCKKLMFATLGAGAFCGLPFCTVAAVGLGRKVWEPQLGYTITDPTVTYGYRNLTLCTPHTEKCPDFSVYDELTEVVENYREVQLEEALKAVPPPSARSEDSTFEVPEHIVELFTFILLQLEVASYCFIAYKCLSLYVPIPLSLMSPNLRVRGKMFIFGANKATFVIFVVCVWWLIKSVHVLDLLKGFVEYLHVFRQDPCITNRQYLSYIGGNVSSICDQLFESHSNWTTTVQAIRTIVELTKPMETCCSKYPRVFLSQVMQNMSLNVDTPLSVGLIEHDHGTFLCGDDHPSCK